MLKTDFTYSQLLEWDKYDLAEHILDLQDQVESQDLFYKTVLEGFKSKTK
jgi:hypothetical protein